MPEAMPITANRRFPSAAAIALLGILACVQSASAGEPDPFAREARPLLENYCYGCHGSDASEAELDLSAFPDEASLASQQEAWLAVVEKLRGRVMPPEHEPQPDEADRAKLVEIISAAMDRVDQQRPPSAGRVPLRRLNRVEYENTLRDLLGVELKLTDDFPADDMAHGFDNVAEGLTLSPLLLEKYLAAGERALEQVVVTNSGAEFLDQRLAGADLRGRRRSHGGENRRSAEQDFSALELGLEDEAGAEFDLPATDEYAVRVRAWRNCEAEDPATLVLKVGGVDTMVWSVTAGEENPAVLEASLPLGAGSRQISLRHTWSTARVSKEDPLPEIRAYVDYLEVQGPIHVLAHRRIFFVEPSDQLSDREAARLVLARFASLALRRPAQDDEVERLLALYHRSREASRTHVEATRAALAAVLVSPHFLFHIERDATRPDNHGAYRLSDWELASRLSYFLWSSMPDDELRELAAAGRLHDDAVLCAQVRRMLADPKSAALVQNFGGQWLGLRRLETLSLDRETYPRFNDSLRRAMGEEARRFFETIMREDRSIHEFVSTDWTWMNEDLAGLYGERGVQGNHFRRVALTDPSRGGVITMPATLAITSLPTRTSAVKRGKWILEEILGAPPPPPPPDVPELEPASAEQRTGLTLREKLERHRADPRCYACHVQMDALGLGLENFDPLGRWRKQDGGRDIDPSGELPGGRTFAGPAELKSLLSQRKEDFTRCLTEKMFVYALGRGLTGADRREVQRVVEALDRDGGRFSTLIVEIVRSYPFRYREVEPRNEKSEAPTEGAVDAPTDLP
jgi:mono/diheme cytochrome c family protein